MSHSPPAGSAGSKADLGEEWAMFPENAPAVVTFLEDLASSPLDPWVAGPELRAAVRPTPAE